jgi:hypothetical protein
MTNQKPLGSPVRQRELAIGHSLVSIMPISAVGRGSASSSGPLGGAKKNLEVANT